MGAKLATMLVALACGVVTTRLIVGNAGPSYFALYTLLTALPALFTFLDLGSGAAVVNGVATSADPRHDERLAATVTTVSRIILVVGAVTLLLNLVLLQTGGWTHILGVSGELPDSALAAVVCLTIFCCSIALAIWQRVLLGLRKNHVIVLLQGLQSPLNLGIVWFLIDRHDMEASAYLGIGTFVAVFLVGLLGYVVADRLTRPLFSVVRRRMFKIRRYPNAQVMDVGWPMMAQVLAAPLAITLQRYVLAQSASDQQVAQYGVLAQVFIALLGLISATGLSLWPFFARARQFGTVKHGPYLLSLTFGGATLAATAVIWAVREPLFGFITRGEIVVQPVHVLLFGLMVAVQASLYPLGMFIMDREGLRFQVLPVVLMVVSTIGLTFLLTPAIGVAGPLVASAGSTIVFQVIPFSLYIHRHRQRLWGAGPRDDASVPLAPSDATS